MRTLATTNDRKIPVCVSLDQDLLNELNTRATSLNKNRSELARLSLRILLALMGGKNT